MVNLVVCVFPQSPSHKSKRQQQELIQELRRKQVKDSRHVYEGKDGTIEDIITGNITRSRLQSAVNRTCLILCMKGHLSLKQRISKPTNTMISALFEVQLVAK